MSIVHRLPLYVDQARAKACFDTLTGWSQEMTAQPRLAQSWQPDATLKVDRPPFSDPRLREAVRYGIDREALVRVVLLGRGEPGNDMFGRGLQYYPSAAPQIARDVARARELVREAGADGLAVELQTSGADPTFDPATTVLDEQLAEIGLRVTPRVLPSAGYFKQIGQSGVLSQNSTGALPIPDYIGRRMVTTATSYDFTGYRNPEVDRLYAAAVSTRDEAARPNTSACARFDAARLG